MKSYIIFSSRAPFLIVTNGTIRDAAVTDHLRRIGCPKFISREVPIERVSRQYGRRFEITAKDIADGHVLQVLDSSGPNVFDHLPFSEFRGTYRCESSAARMTGVSSTRSAGTPA
jgi:hypothetical protein